MFLPGNESPNQQFSRMRALAQAAAIFRLPDLLTSRMGFLVPDGKAGATGLTECESL